jgi:ABC-type enterochelin transport system permease subunit|tara:strand:- start:378 stop:650 length:273 start_codon:yes stop_codon:yes gene_type:complete
MLDWIPDGIAYGLIDNGVLAFSTLLGIDIDKYFKGSGIHGAIYGALFGNTLSDFLGAIVDFPLELAINITAGCLIVIPIVWFILLFKKQS